MNNFYKIKFECLKIKWENVTISKYRILIIMIYDLDFSLFISAFKAINYLIHDEDAFM